MFPNELYHLPLVDDEVSYNFSHIVADPYQADMSFRATMRALLFERLPSEDCTAALRVIVSTPENLVGLNTMDRTLSAPSFNSRNEILVFVCKGYTDEEFGNIHSSAGRVLSSFNYLTDVSLYLKQSGSNTHVYVDEYSRHAVVLVNSMSLRTWHKMQSALPKLMPWLFQTPLSDFEKRLLHSLTKKDSKEYVKLITEFANKEDFRADRIKKALKGFGVVFEQEKLNNLRNERLRVQRDFERLQNEVSKIIERDAELCSSINWFEEVIASNDGCEISDYFICNKALNLQSVFGRNLNYIVATYLEYYDQQVFERYLQNSESYFYTSARTNGISSEDFRLLLEACFGMNRCIKIRVFAEFRLQLPGTIAPVKTSIKDGVFHQWLPHPHIDGHGCLGANATYINKCMNERLFIEAIEQTVAATKNINFTDSTVGMRLISEMHLRSESFFELPDGSVVTQKAAIEWIKSGGVGNWG